MTCPEKSPSIIYNWTTTLIDMHYRPFDFNQSATTNTDNTIHRCSPFKSHLMETHQCPLQTSLSDIQKKRSRSAFTLRPSDVVSVYQEMTQVIKFCFGPRSFY
ncbi:hypothetical protein GDO78_009112 [Eleutherodactylus coqui]|uniref:Uncharacterized protein n=1 Tax=Eleutherodactylus coqui TaxID=57060 RepID=A0A8J6KBV1_ELECQ|nr:hypothetical protein GDO78_009112 [Eleutherodactylus coqui]